MPFPPEPLTLLRAVSDALGVVSEAIRHEFPKPVLPPDVVKQIYDVAVRELCDEQKGEQ